MASSIDKANRVAGSSQAEISYNYQNAELQGQKTAFRVHKTALLADKYNPARLDNAIQQTLSST